jgi:hypothetical protein
VAWNFFKSLVILAEVRAARTSGDAYARHYLLGRTYRRDLGDPLFLRAPVTPMPTADTASPLRVTTSYVQWGPILAGALAAAALATVLHVFAVAIGLAVSSTAPTWRDSSLALVLLSGLYLVLAALVAYGAGGYIAGRLRTPLAGANDDEVEFRDGAHGLAVWALATLLTAFLAFAATQSVTQLAAPSGGEAGPSTSVGGENIIAYDLDRLFRTDRERPTDFEYARAEAARILLTASGHAGVQADDRGYLLGLVTRHTGLQGADAEARVSETLMSASDNIAQARRSIVLVAFMGGAAALLGAAAAWFAACLAGRHRDTTPVSMMWTWQGPPRRSLR